MTVLNTQDKAFLKRLVWKTFTKNHGISLRADALDYLVAHTVTLEGLDVMLSSMAEYCVSNSSTFISLNQFLDLDFPS
jgi:hypothetical protein